MRLKTTSAGAALLTILLTALCLPALAGTVGVPTVSPSALAAGLVGKQANLKVIVDGPGLNGVVGNGTTDDSATLQAQLTALGAAGGGELRLLPGHYGITNLSVPPSVTLDGPGGAVISSEAGPFGAGGATAPGQGGAWLYVLTAPGAQQGNTTAAEDTRTPSILLAENAGVANLSMYWPGQNQAATGNPYAFPWAIKQSNAGGSNNASVRDVQLLNPYQGVWCDGQRATIRNVDGQALYIGARVDNCGDTCRWEDIHWNPFWSFASAGANTGVFTWQCKNGIGFDFRRSDGQVGSNLFCYGYGVGYLFESDAPGNAGTGVVGGRSVGATYGQFSNCGADLCANCVVLAQTQAPQGVHFSCFQGVPTQTNTGGTGTLGVGIQAQSTYTGVASFVGGAFWGPSTNIGSFNGAASGEITLSGMSFSDWAASQVAFGVGAGVITIDACRFRESGTAGQVYMTAGASTRLLFTANTCKGAVNILGNGSGDIVANNAAY